ncbi:hypothetical protein JCM11251_006882 [Rhodosporidiobolus azoricus]
MSLLHSLPPELVNHILVLSILPTNASNPDPLTRRQTLRQLHSLSLTCRAFRPLAQRELLRLAHRDGETLKAFHAKEFGRFCSVVLEEDEEGKFSRKEEEGLAKLFRQVDVELWGEDAPEDLVQALKACEGREEVMLACVERLKFEEVALGENLTALSARQCSFVGPPPPCSSPPSPPPLLPPLPTPLCPALRSLSLHLVTLRRSSLPLNPSRSLPNLRDLLLFLGSPSSLSSGDQHFPTIRSFIRGVAPQLRALSVDHTAFEYALKPEREAEGEEPLAFPNLRIYGLYFDAAHLSLVGSSLFFPSPSPSLDKTSISSFRTPLLPTPPNLHPSLYPSPFALPVLEGLLASLFETAEGAVRWAWRGVEEFRLDGLVRDLDTDWTGDTEEGDEEEEEVDEQEEEEGGEANNTRVAEETEGPRLTHLLSLASAAGIPCTIDSRPPALPLPDDGRAGERLERGTFKRGFETSWWKFVKEVEGRG